MKTLSIIIPCFNEEKNLPKLFFALKEYVNSQNKFELEIVFINDGSTDQTHFLIEQFIRDYSYLMRQISYNQNKGKGFAVRKGMLEAKGDWRVFLDADLAVSLDQIEKINPYIDNINNIIIGSRVSSSSQIAVSQNAIRQYFGKVFTSLANIVTGLRISDFTCGFKCFSKEATEKIFPNTKINHWTFDAEVLCLARRYNFDIQEVGVVWRNGSDSKVRIGKDIVGSFIDL
ncbi:MAG: dolichyl-phosphate beta-glucosyltransferase, partial [Patescibacteria group bacterium]